MVKHKFVITTREDQTVSMTIRIEKTLQAKYSDLSAKVNRSRNKLIGMALQYALDNMDVEQRQDGDDGQGQG